MIVPKISGRNITIVPKITGHFRPKNNRSKYKLLPEGRGGTLPILCAFGRICCVSLVVCHY